MYPSFHTLFTPSNAKKIIDSNNQYEVDGWSYKIEDIGNSKGLVAIAVYDEENVLIGYF
jgi:hypothetical protein